MSVFNFWLCLAQTIGGLCSLFFFFQITEVQVNTREKEIMC